MDQNINDSKSHIWIFFLKILLQEYNFFYIRQHVLVDTVRVFFNFRFFSSKSQSQQKLTKKITHFTIQFCSKNLTHFTNLYSLDIENNMLLLLTLQIFQQTSFCLVSEKAFALHHFLTPKNCILEALWMQTSVYFCISPSEKRSKIWTSRLRLRLNFS